MLREITKLALRNIRRRSLRSALTIMGIAVGVASIVLFVSIGEGLKSFVIGSLGDVGTELIVTPGINSKNANSGLKYSYVREIERIPGVKGASPRVHDVMLMEYRGRSEPVIVIGVDAEREKKLGVSVGTGRFLKSSDRYAAVLGYVRQNVTSPDAASTINIKLRQRILLEKDDERYSFRVVGVLDEGGMAGGVFSGVDGGIVIPITTFRKISDEDEISQIVVVLDDPKDIDRVSEEIKDITGGNIISMKKVVESIGSFFRIVQVFFFIVGSVALVVAGLGIMNTMLMSVLERTREIGILKSLGAKKKHIAGIFLAEAGVMGMVGGVAGTAAGAAVGKIGSAMVTLIISRSMNLKSSTLPHFIVIPEWLVAFSIVFSVLMSMIFGLYPAWKAASLEPAEALRHI